MDKIEPIRDFIVSAWGSYPALVVFAGLLAWSLFKKVVKLAVFAGICLLIWFFASQSGFNIGV